MGRIIRIGGSFAIVLVAYWAYALVAVPLIEPSAERHYSDPLSEEELNNPDHLAKQHWRKDLEGLFPPGSWELDEPKILEIDSVKLLLQDYTRLDDGSKVEIRPCTMIFMPEGSAANALQRKRGSVILEAPKALLEFDEPFDLRRAKVGRLVSGRLKGRITIRSQGKSAGPEDDLLVVTRDVDLNEERVWTPHPVDFRLGANYGSGRQMRIKLLPGNEHEGAKRRGPNIAGIELFEIRRLERLHLHFGEEGFAHAQQGTGPVCRNGPEGASHKLDLSPFLQDARPNGRAKSGLESDLPIEVTCRGPFRFDPIEQVATFEDHVDVKRDHPEGPSDQLNCEMLSVYFSRPRKGVPAPAKDPPDGSALRPSPALQLKPRRIEARGTPVVVRAPSQQLDARGERLEYDFQSGRIVLDGAGEVFLKHGTDEIHARNLQYQSAGSGRLGQVVAEGPGWLRGQMTDLPSVGDQGRPSESAGRQLEARWTELLRVRPHDEQHVISLTGGAEVSFGGLGRLSAAEIHFWLFEAPPTGQGGRSQLRPDRMLAQGEVQLSSPQLIAAVDEAGVWFEQAPEREQGLGQPDEGITPNASGRSGPPPARAAEPAARAPQVGRLPAEGPIGREATSGSPSPSFLPGAARLPIGGTSRCPAEWAGGTSSSSPSDGRPQHQFEIVGQVLQARVLVRGEETELAELTIERGVRLRETLSAEPNQRPVVVSGELIHVVDAGQPHRAVTVSGSPAHFEGRGLGLTGSNINLNCGTNRLWIDGPGWMDLPLDRDLDGRPLGDPGHLRVQWQQRMTFDGRTARFEESVLATSRQLRGRTELNTETLDVSFLRPIRFADLAERPEPEIERIVCHGGMFMESRSYEGQAQSSLDRMQVARMDINLLSGATTAAGPGWMTTVRRGSADPVTSPAGQGPTIPALTPTDPDDDRLSYLNVRFQGSLSGNLHNRRMTFHDQVETVYGPVDSWQAKLDPDDPDGLGPRGVLLSCRQLSVAEMPLPTGDGRTVELEAQGNVVVEGQTFTARGARMTYADAKQLLILEAGGRTDAELYHQKHIGGPFSEFLARRILYWRSTGQVHFEGARSLKSN